MTRRNKKKAKKNKIGIDKIRILRDLDQPRSQGTLLSVPFRAEKRNEHA